jgi:hypothetical protein
MNFLDADYSKPVSCGTRRPEPSKIAILSAYDGAEEYIEGVGALLEVIRQYGLFATYQMR